MPDYAGTMSAIRAQYLSQNLDSRSVEKVVRSQVAQ